MLYMFVIYSYIYYNNIVWAYGAICVSMCKCYFNIACGIYFNIYLLQHNIVWACGSVILIHTFITTQYCVSMWKCYFNIYLLQHNIVWARGSVIFTIIRILVTTQYCVSMWKCYFNIHLLFVGAHVECVILIYIYYNTILCELF